MEKGTCKKCGNEDWIVNKRHHICKRCNRERLDSQSTKKPSIKRLVSISKKTKKIITDYSKTINEIDKERPQVCEGCGQADHLSNSHLYSRQKCRNKGRHDLISEKENIRKHCVMNSRIAGANGRGCHDLWEQNWGEDNYMVVAMLDFKENIAYLKEIDYLWVNRIFGKYLK